MKMKDVAIDRRNATKRRAALFLVGVCMNKRGSHLCLKDAGHEDNHRCTNPKHRLKKSGMNCGFWWNRRKHLAKPRNTRYIRLRNELDQLNRKMKNYSDNPDVGIIDLTDAITLRIEPIRELLRKRIRSLDNLSGKGKFAYQKQLRNVHYALVTNTLVLRALADQVFNLFRMQEFLTDVARSLLKKNTSIQQAKVVRQPRPVHAADVQRNERRLQGQGKKGSQASSRVKPEYKVTRKANRSR